MNASEFLTVDDVAARLGLGARTIRSYIRDGKLPAVRMGKQYRIARADLEAFTGHPSDTRKTARRHRHSEASAIVSIDAVPRDLAHRISTMLTAGAATRPGAGRPLRVDTIYDEERAHLKVVVIGGVSETGDVLALIDALTTEDRP